MFLQTPKFCKKMLVHLYLWPDGRYRSKVLSAGKGGGSLGSRSQT